jgi:recombination protein RecA
MYGLGISKSGEILYIGVELDVIQKAGSWFSYEGNKLGQGRDSVKTLIEDNPELMEELELKIKSKISGKSEEKEKARQDAKDKVKADKAEKAEKAAKAEG